MENPELEETTEKVKGSTYTPQAKKAFYRWVDRNREKWNDYQRKWHLKHSEVTRKSVMKWREKHRDKYNAYQREYQKRRYWERKKQQTKGSS